ncbi:DUF1028 domain-containing protein [Halobacillus sp. ACCC02827]|uniref:DUF1028 domain-containing protein n=1 Tax=unclassified Halobacillus TaxID=2636472 RepID=UPI0002A51542|nr:MULTISPECIES: DUF1028 domain-containing protein [unclassified Halobacillus]ELK47792.1 hypothetical protein D479_05490 [Halobacillus sp. BAB-2008]WJE16272.1 DUF1028 domain-containing protein [Halobacillus sp. ACCC02827]
MKLNTFSIMARCPETGNFGAAVATRFPGVGAYSPHIEPNVGIVITQGWVNPALGQEGVDHLKKGRTANETLNHLLFHDPGKELRQVSVMDQYGNSSVYTGVENDDYKGHIVGDQWAVQGNLLAGPEVLEQMVSAFKEAEGSLAEKLLEALHAGDAAGGDIRGKQSAVIKVASVKGFPFVDFRVDDHENPVQELRRIYDKNKSVLIDRYHEWIDAVKEGIPLD